MHMSVRVRIAPSPTGDPHVGTAYVALFNAALARQRGGQFVLRIEDTDRGRYVANSERQIFDTLHWLGLDWDEGPDRDGPRGPYRQSERLPTYQQAAQKLVELGYAYYCWCSPERLDQMRAEQMKNKQPTGYDRLCLGLTREQRAQLPGFDPTPVIRMRVPDHDVPLTFDDMIRGPTNAPMPDDQVILKKDGYPTYHLAVVVDDHEMGITHVLRAEEWISSMPKQLLLYRFFGWHPPRYAHLPLLRHCPLASKAPPPVRACSSRTTATPACCHSPDPVTWLRQVVPVRNALLAAYSSAKLRNGEVAIDRIRPHPHCSAILLNPCCRLEKARGEEFWEEEKNASKF